MQSKTDNQGLLHDKMNRKNSQYVYHMLDVLNIVLPAFVVILIGYIFGKIRKTANISPLVDIAFYIGAPALTFVSMVEKEIATSLQGAIAEPATHNLRHAR